MNPLEVLPKSSGDVILQLGAGKMGENGLNLLEYRNIVLLAGLFAATAFTGEFLFISIISGLGLSTLFSTEVLFRVCGSSFYTQNSLPVAKENLCSILSGHKKFKENFRLNF
jgi:hypothetical protein